jgi:hypothetical protein
MIQLLCTLVFENGAWMGPFIDLHFGQGTNVDGRNFKTLSASPNYSEILEWLSRYLVLVVDSPDVQNEHPAWANS